MNVYVMCTGGVNKQSFVNKLTISSSQGDNMSVLTKKKIQLWLFEQ